MEVLQEDIDDILALGVRLVTGCEVGVNVTLGELKQQGFSAILLAGGLSESRTLAVPGIDSEGISLALPFLRTVRAGGRVALGSRVVVIGGGNVATDVARSARRLGVEQVTMVSLESRQEMPAYDWEIQEALEEEVEILNSWGPKAVFSEDGRLRGLELRRCAAVFDESGRFNPTYNDRDVKTLPADSCILAIGQRAELVALRGSGLEPASGGRLPYDPGTLSLPLEGVFACGEMATGPGSAVEAVADGHRAASAIAHYLDTGELRVLPQPEYPTVGDLPERTAERVRPLLPVAVKVRSASERLESFAEIELAFTEAEARAEARRCLACTTGAFPDEERCAGCLTCARICPFGVATVEKTAVMPQEKCQACGLCAAQCPAAAIALKRFGTNRMKEQLRAQLEASPLVGRERPLLVSYCCLFEVTSRRFTSQESFADDVLRVMVPCVGRLSLADLLAPFELGADGVVVIGCREGECLYPTAEEAVGARVKRAKGVLAEINLEDERIDFWRTQDSAEVSWTAFWGLSKRKLRQLLGAKEGSRVDDRG
jgi:coenzyme F420-reducing hydrogenase delta subunit/ferredoxin